MSQMSRCPNDAVYDLTDACWMKLKEPQFWQIQPHYDRRDDKLEFSCEWSEMKWNEMLSC